MFNNVQPRKAEHLHTKKCLGTAMKAAIENAYDLEGFTDHEFRLYAQDNAFLQEADNYLREGLMTCICPVCHNSCCDGYFKHTFDTETERNLEAI